jgi:cyclic beta-1,2-glucan synthetase
MKPAVAESRARLRPASAADSSQTAELSNGEYHVFLNRSGSGYSQLSGTAVTRWSYDELLDANGFFIYLRDLNDYGTWSIGERPGRTTPQSYEFDAGPRSATIHRLENGILARVDVIVAPEHSFEIRRLSVSNLSEQSRRIEVTSYLEWVLTSPEADASHPAFSKLFVETEFCFERSAILARRRPRRCDESEFWGFHAILVDVDRFQEELEFETNRYRFIGRGRTLAAPQALEPGAVLTADTGAVLDPAASLRTAVALEPGETRCVTFALGAATSRDAIDEMLRVASDGPQVQRLVEKSLVPAAAALESSHVRYATHNNGDGDAAGGPALSKVQVQKYRRDSHERSASSGGLREALRFENGYGGFTAGGEEYRIRLMPEGRGGHRHPPLPWANVICNEQGGFLVTERGAGHTWSANSRLNRLTAWHNDPVIDPHSEALWIRDEDERVFWSPTPGPTPAAEEYRVRHGFGYTAFEHESHELAQQVTMFMTASDPVKVVRLRIANHGDRQRHLSIFSFIQWALGGLVSETAGQVSCEHDGECGALLARNPHRELYGDFVAFSAPIVETAVGRKASYTCDRVAFLGRNGSVDTPAALAANDELDGEAGAGVDQCAAWQIPVQLPPGGEFECSFLLGEAADRSTAAELIEKYRRSGCVATALAEVKQFWRSNLSRISIETPDPEIDFMVNGWLMYQNLSCRMWGRSAYYQPGGAFGFRDQLQDSAALMLVRPDITRAQILRHAAQQFVEGDVLHWWHPDTGYGVRTRFSDDLLWLPMVSAEYVRMTGDRQLLDEEAPFVTAPPLASGQQEAYLRPAPSGEYGTIYEHCCRALDRGLTVGPHGLPLIGCGDWNDGFSRVGQAGRGESVWLGFFIDYVLERMLPICASRGDAERAERYNKYRARLREAIDRAGWDGAWYRRAYYDNGEPMGSTTSDECQIDALAQAWAVISGIASPDRARSAIEAVEERLIDDGAGIIRLLTPPFNRTPHDAGYIKGYLPGIRENGGQYTHGVLWVVRALAEMGRGTRATQLLRMIGPVWHASSHERADIYQTEPYVVAADIYGHAPHVGRGGWTWYTGSAGWMYRVAVESIFGISLEEGRTLCIKPAISSHWPRCRMTYRLPGSTTTYEIAIENPEGREHGVSGAAVDGQPATVDGRTARIPLVDDGATHRVAIQV